PAPAFLLARYNENCLSEASLIDSPWFSLGSAAQSILGCFSMKGQHENTVELPALGLGFGFLFSICRRALRFEVRRRRVGLLIDTGCLHDPKKRGGGLSGGFEVSWTV